MATGYNVDREYYKIAMYYRLRTMATKLRKRKSVDNYGPICEAGVIQSWIYTRMPSGKEVPGGIPINVL